MEDEEETVAYPPMNPHTKQKWVKALRSGEYEQGSGALVIRDRVEYQGVTRCCCLGVLLMETTPEFCTLEHTPPDQHGEFGVPVPFRASWDGVATGIIPDDLAMMYDLTDEAQSLLSEMNDNGGNFPTIADWIEGNL